MKKKLMQRIAELFAWSRPGLPYLDAVEDCQKSNEELRQKVRDLERSLAE